MSLLGLFDRIRKGWVIHAFTVILAVSGPMSSTGADDHGWDDGAPPPTDEIVPLQGLLTRIREHFQGRILEVEIEQEWHHGGRIWVYEAKLLTPKGHVLKLEYNAKSLELLEVKGRHERGRDTCIEDTGATGADDDDEH